jgi:nucleoside-diphosphate-sugar epimerase
MRFCRNLLNGVEGVFHLAALIPIPYSYLAPASYVETNVSGTLNMCAAALDAGVRRFIHVSTSEVYGTAQFVPMDESHPLRAQSPYSATKIGADAIASSFCYSFGLPVAIARPFNVYGPRQSARAVIPTIVAQLAAGRQSIRLGDTSTTRDFTFVRDTCKGLVAIAEMDGGLGEVFDIGSSFEISVGALFQAIALLMNSEAVIEADDARKRPAKSEMLRLWCNNTKLYSATGFRPETSLEQGLLETIEWLRCPENLKRYQTELYNV